MTTTQGIKLDDDTRKRLADLAAKRDRTPHYLMKKAIETYLEKEEKYEQEKAEDLARWERYQLTGEATDHDDAKQWLATLANPSSKANP